MILLLLACAPKAPPPAECAPPPGELLLLHTNDMHAHYLPERADWLEGEPSIGGFALLDAHVRAARAACAPVALLDGGDILTGTPLSDLEVRGSRGGAMIELMEAVGYDAWVLGNHEFDKGYDNIAALVAASGIPALSANLHARDGGPAMPGLRPHHILEVNGLRVGVFGLTTEGMGHLAPLSVMERVRVEDAAQAARAQIAELDPVTDLIVALTHSGLEADRRLAEQVSGLDLIVGGHSHTPMREVEVVNGVPIVQAGSYTRSLGTLRLRVEGDALVGVDYSLVDMLPEAAPGAPSPEVQALVDRYAAQIEAEYGQVISEARVTLGRAYAAESDLGNWVTDVLREATGADLAVYNSGGLRADLVAGPVTRRALYEILPFGNMVVTFELSGEEVLGVLLANALAAQTGDRGATQISGARIVWQERLGAPEVVEATVGGRPLDPKATYTVASNSYVAERAARYLAGATAENLQALGRTDFDLVVEAAARGPIERPEPGRTVQAGR